MIKAVIFDRDGVLLDSEYTNVRAAELMFAEMGIVLSESDKQGIVGQHPDDYLLPFLKRHHIDVAKFKDRQRVLYYEVLEETPVFGHMIALVRDLHARHVPIALCTSSSRSGTERVLAKLGVWELFHVVVTKDDYTKRKPDPEPYVVTAGRLGVQPGECAVIEDSAVGVKAAVAAGMKCVAVPNDYTWEHDFAGATMVVHARQDLSADQVLSI